MNDASRRAVRGDWGFLVVHLRLGHAVVAVRTSVCFRHEFERDFFHDAQRRVVHEERDCPAEEDVVANADGRPLVEGEAHNVSVSASDELACTEHEFVDEWSGGGGGHV